MFAGGGAKIIVTPLENVNMITDLSTKLFIYHSDKHFSL